MSAYSAAAETLVGRILALVPKNPQIMAFESVWDLFKVPGFKCDDIGPSLAQASWALAEAKRRYRKMVV